MVDRAALDGVRSILESPILDPRKWAKIPSIPCDSVLLDMEDSVPPDRKDEARDRVIAQLSEPGYLGGRVPIPRANSLQTPWGEADLRALGAAHATLFAYPKLQTADELRAVQQVVRASGADPAIVVIIETARAILDLERIFAIPEVVGAILGPSDLSVDAGWTMFDGDRRLRAAYHYPKSKLSLASAAFGVPAYDMVFVPDLKNPDQVRELVIEARQFGYAGVSTFYPPHVDIINSVFTPSAQEVSTAREVVAAYEAALADGRAAVQVNGQMLIVQDYKRAQTVLRRARR